MSGSVKVVVTVWAKPDAADKIAAIVRELCTESRKEKGCISYAVLRNNAERTNFVLYEEWLSDSHLDAHNTTPHFAKAVTSAQPFLAKPLEVGRYSTVM
jgi:quinol monooxygenase YgiN